MTTLLASCRRGAAVAALVLFSGSAAFAQVATRKGLTIDGAKSIATAAANEARRLGAGGAIALVDEGGNLLYLERLENTFPAASTVAMSAQQDDDIATVAANAANSMNSSTVMPSMPSMMSNSAAPPSGDRVTFISGAQTMAAFEKGQPLIETATYKVHASRRQAAGMAEVHTRDTDIIYVLEGRATIVTGGSVVDGKTITADEVRGARIDNGTTRTLAKGDVLIVPEGVPHWFTDVKGPFLYYVVKVTAPAGATSSAATAAAMARTVTTTATATGGTR
jgi:mannose-6-phosphate isomerase-like protein (cupin superfamily)